MSVKMLRNLIGVVPAGKNTNRKQGLFVMPETSNNLGVIKYVGEDVKTFKPGEKVYFGNSRETIIMQGEEVMVMEESNIVATLEDEDQDEKETQKSSEDKTAL